MRNDRQRGKKKAYVEKVAVLRTDSCGDILVAELRVRLCSIRLIVYLGEYIILEVYVCVRNIYTSIPQPFYHLCFVQFSIFVLFIYKTDYGIWISFLHSCWVST